MSGCCCGWAFAKGYEWQIKVQPSTIFSALGMVMEPGGGSTNF